MNCLRCEGEMELGYQVDGLGRAAYRQSQWAAGPPQSNDETFLGMKMYEEWALKLEEDDLKAIVTYRCTDCGYLENYAP